MVNGGAVSDVFLELQDLLDVAAAYQKVPVAKSLRIKGKKWQEEVFFMFLFYFFFLLGKYIKSCRKVKSLQVNS